MKAGRHRCGFTSPFVGRYKNSYQCKSEPIEPVYVWISFQINGASFESLLLLQETLTADQCPCECGELEEFLYEIQTVCLYKKGNLTVIKVGTAHILQDFNMLSTFLMIWRGWCYSNGQ